MEIINHHTLEIQSSLIAIVNMQKLLEGFYLTKMRFLTIWYFLGRLINLHTKINIQTYQVQMDTWQEWKNIKEWRLKSYMINKLDN